MTRKTTLAALFAPALLAAFYAVACTGEEPNVSGRDAGAGETSAPGLDASPDGAPGTDAGAPTLAASPARPFVRVGSGTTTELTLTRRGVGGEIPITVTKVPAGVTATANPIPVSGTTTTLKIDAAVGATVGNGSIMVSAPGAPDLTIDIVVAGAPGTRDTSFATGLLVDATATSFEAALVLPGGALVVAGTAPGGWMVRRYDASGKPDAAFEAAAKSILPTTGSAMGLALDPITGKIVVVGRANVGASQYGTIVRLLPTGAPDVSLASTGLVSLTSHAPGSDARAALVGPSESIVVVGRRAGPPYVERYTAAGALDATFQSYALGDGAFNAIAALDGGTMLAAGTSILTSPAKTLLRKMNPNGTLDTTWGNGGVRELTADCSGMALALLGGGDAFVVGTAATSPNACGSSVPMTGTGTPRWSRTISGSSPQGLAAAAGPGDLAYAIGVTGGMNGTVFVEAVLPDGGVDGTFGTAGTFEIDDSSAFAHAAASGDGRLFVVGEKAGAGAFVLALWQ